MDRFAWRTGGGGVGCLLDVYVYIGLCVSGIGVGLIEYVKRYRM